jgi:hypothetical protein
MLVLALTYTLLRLQYMYAVSAAALVIGYYTAKSVLFPMAQGSTSWLPTSTSWPSP